MSDFGSALERARKHYAAVERLESALRKRPEDRKLRIDLTSMRRLALKTQEQMYDLARVDEVDLVRYRIVNKEENYILSNVADSLSQFQKSITALYDAKVNGPKQKAKYSHDTEEESGLRFAYSYPGSLGIVLAIENRRGLFVTHIDEVAEAFEQILEISDADDALEASKTLGIAAISTISKWVSTNHKWNNGVDYAWRRSDGVSKGEYIDTSHFGKLSAIFQEAKEVERKPFDIIGVLVGVDLEDGRFHIVQRHGETYRGRLSDEFERAPTEVDRAYKARLVREETRYPATGQVSVNYFLNKLSDAD